MSVAQGINKDIQYFNNGLSGTQGALTWDNGNGNGNGILKLTSGSVSIGSNLFNSLSINTTNSITSERNVIINNTILNENILSNSVTIGNIAISDGKITGLNNPTSGTDIVNKGYISNISVKWLDPVKYLSTSNIDLSLDTVNSGIGTVPGISGTITPGDRVLLKNQNNGIQNGIYITANKLNTWERVDLTSGISADNIAVYVTSSNLKYIQSYKNVITNTHSLLFVPFLNSYLYPGIGLTASGNKLNVTAFDSTIVSNNDGLSVGIVPIGNIIDKIPTSKLVNKNINLSGDVINETLTLGKNTKLNLKNVLRLTNEQTISGDKKYTANQIFGSNIFLYNTISSIIYKTGDLNISSGGKIVINSVIFDNSSITAKTLNLTGNLSCAGNVSVSDIIGNNDNFILNINSVGNIVLKSIIFNESMSNVGTLALENVNIKGDITVNSINHTGKVGSNLNISSGGNILINSVIFNNSSLSVSSLDATTINVSGDLNINSTNITCDNISSSKNIIINTVVFNKGSIGVNSLKTSTLNCNDNIDLKSDVLFDIEHKSGTDKNLIISSGGKIVINSVVFNNNNRIFAKNVVSKFANISGILAFNTISNVSINNLSDVDLSITSNNSININGVYFVDNNISNLNKLTASDNLKCKNINLTAKDTSIVSYTDSIEKKLDITSGFGKNVVIESIIFNGNDINNVYSTSCKTLNTIYDIKTPIISSIGGSELTVLTFNNVKNDINISGTNVVINDFSFKNNTIINIDNIELKNRVSTNITSIPRRDYIFTINSPSGTINVAKSEVKQFYSFKVNNTYCKSDSIVYTNICFSDDHYFVSHCYAYNIQNGSFYIGINNQYDFNPNLSSQDRAYYYDNIYFRFAEITWNISFYII